VQTTSGAFVALGDAGAIPATAARIGGAVVGATAVARIADY
jgi:hypothetical protein